LSATSLSSRTLSDEDYSLADAIALMTDELGDSLGISGVGSLTITFGTSLSTTTAGYSLTTTVGTSLSTTTGTSLTVSCT
tara:strand:+ start:94 stop:333 length:240 start_codon:yes stop_codon:yes gene_type:complete